MNGITVSCPNCARKLNAPASAAGKGLRCPVCRTAFKVPNVSAADDEDLFSNWIEEDVDGLQEEQDEQWRRRLQEERDAKAAKERARLAKTRQRLEEVLDKEGDDETARPESPIDAQETEETEPQPATTVEQPAQPAALPDTARLSDEKRYYDTSDDAVDEPAQVGEAREYPTELVLTEPMPRLVVQNVSQQGVLLAFDARFCEHIGFRLSIPRMCAFSGVTDEADLIAKPLAFIDQTQGAVRNAQTVEVGHQATLSENFSPRQLLAHMGALETMPRPFNSVIPYYVATHNASLSLTCSTADRQDGLTCSVLIPHGPVALRWLAAVNGICGREYHMLAEEVNELWGQAWGDVDEEARQRLGLWCNFEPGERFQTYIRDSEFGKKDEGLAGVVLTDRRLIYHRYHHKGSVRLDDASTQLEVRPDASDAIIVVKTVDGNIQAAKLHVEDLTILRDRLEGTALRLDLARMRTKPAKK